jgi:hypothetical protein
MQRENWAQRRRIGATDAIPLPDGIDLKQAAMLRINPTTALCLLEDQALRQEARTRRFAGRVAGGSHKSASGVPEISVFNRYSPDSRRFRDKVAPLAGLGNRKSYWRHATGASAPIPDLPALAPE